MRIIFVIQNTWQLCESVIRKENLHCLLTDFKKGGHQFELCNIVRIAQFRINAIIPTSEHLYQIS